MFSYYGSKSKIVRYYPLPKFDKIIEPFAGSARYSLKYWQKDITIVDKYDVVIRIWEYLQSASINDILGLPNLKKGDDLRLFNLSDIERDFLGFIIKSGDVSPKNIVCSNRGEKDQIKNILKNISEQLYKIRHWKIIHGNYEDLQNETATWFIDPPYQFGGEHYKENTKNINFAKLSIWCKNRNGQSIVCENSKADWLPFKPMTDMQGTMFKTTECIWSNHKTNYDYIQQSIQF